MKPEEAIYLFNQWCPFATLLKGTLDTEVIRIGDRHHGKPYEISRIARWVNRMIMNGAEFQRGGITLIQPLVRADWNTPLDQTIGVIGGITMPCIDEAGNMIIGNMESRRFLKPFAGRIADITADEISLWVHYHPPRETVA